jgi:hypothetical protein
MANSLAWISATGQIPVTIDNFVGNLVTGAVSTIDLALTGGVGAGLTHPCLVIVVANEQPVTPWTVSGISFVAGSATGTWTKFNGYTGGGGIREFEIWYCTGPAAGACTARVTWTGTIGADDGAAGMWSLANVDQVTPLSGYLTDGGSSTASLTTTLTTGGLIVGQLCSAGAQTILTGIQDYTNSNNALWYVGHNAGSGTLAWNTNANGRGMNICNVRAG